MGPQYSIRIGSCVVSVWNTLRFADCVIWMIRIFNMSTDFRPGTILRGPVNDRLEQLLLFASPSSDLSAKILANWGFFGLVIVWMLHPNPASSWGVRFLQ